MIVMSIQSVLSLERGNTVEWMVPGAVSVGDKLDVTDAVTKGADNVLDFNILLASGTVYENTASRYSPEYQD